MNPKATDEQIEEAVESGKVQDVFTDRMLERNQAAKHALAYVKVRVPFPFLFGAVLDTQRFFNFRIGQTSRNYKNRTKFE